MTGSIKPLVAAINRTGNMLYEIKEFNAALTVADNLLCDYRDHKLVAVAAALHYLVQVKKSNSNEIKVLMEELKATCVEMSTPFLKEYVLSGKLNVGIEPNLTILQFEILSDFESHIAGIKSAIETELPFLIMEEDEEYDLAEEKVYFPFISYLFQSYISQFEGEKKVYFNENQDLDEELTNFVKGLKSIYHRLSL